MLYQYIIIRETSIYPFSAGTDFRRQNLTSIKLIPKLKELKMYNDRRPNNIAIQMKRKEQTKTFMVILNGQNPFSFYGLYKHILAL